MGKEKFKRGDAVRIIKYGHLSWILPEDMTESEYENFFKVFPPIQILEESGKILVDVFPEFVGKEAVVDTPYTDKEGNQCYILMGIEEKHLGYFEEQLEKI